MNTFRIALANIRFPATASESVILAEQAIEQAGAARAEIICFPECFVPGYRAKGKLMPPPDASFLERAWSDIAAAAAKANIAVILGTERVVEKSVRATALVIKPDGTFAGFQDKVQLDPSEESAYTPGTGRRIFQTGPLTFGIAICHEGWRYPETVRWPVRQGAQIIFHPQFHEAEPGGYVPSAFADPANSFHEMRDELTNRALPQRVEKIKSICGVAPNAKLISLKVIADIDGTADVPQTAGQGKVSWLLIALDQIQKWNEYGRRLLIHGVNMSLGYDFDPRWFACGQSPLCVEVDRMVHSGVAVVVSAGNGGYSSVVTASGIPQSRYSDMSITDPGNADLAITVGSTHREMPHTYGVSYFSSRGPTGDGRLKPDILAPGERIISCAAGAEQQKYAAAPTTGKITSPVLYCEQTGTSMAAPHVSGTIAAFLSVRREFIGQPEKVKAIFLANAVDLHRERTFRGAGMVDLMKVLQAV